eukprot:TRINITY_DN83894_c0_g1_i1.p2 TRINITY_DN83894_c0_g1~~TRINITY_DN83894_c0_g1_i1.p2  ORF type:complete len:161 (+),score=20.34 TRINITY_DN83894_c0_g1_i1:76-558(+)
MKASLLYFFILKVAGQALEESCDSSLLQAKAVAQVNTSAAQEVEREENLVEEASNSSWVCKYKGKVSRKDDCHEEVCLVPWRSVGGNARRRGCGRPGFKGPSRDACHRRRWMDWEFHCGQYTVGGPTWTDCHASYMCYHKAGRKGHKAAMKDRNCRPGNC